jgi:hypothetical protein
MSCDLDYKGSPIYTFYLKNYHNYWMTYHCQCSGQYGYCMMGLLPILLVMSCSIRQSILRSMGKTKQVSCLASVITWSHSHQLLLVISLVHVSSHLPHWQTISITVHLFKDICGSLGMIKEAQDPWIHGDIDVKTYFPGHLSYSTDSYKNPNFNYIYLRWTATFKLL